MIALYTIREYRFAASVEEAAELLQKSRANAVIGGGTWLRMGKQAIGTAIDLSHLGLDQVAADDQEIIIGGMTALRTLEINPLLKEEFCGVLPESVGHIVGVQFRNMATVGASVFSKYGFSDLITALLALDCEVELALGGRVPLAEFLERPFARDILVALHLRRDGRRAVYATQRRAKTDFGILNVAASRTAEGKYIVSVGARPGVARRSPSAEAAMLSEGPEAAGKAAASELFFRDNVRASAEYRHILAEVMVRRALERLEEGNA